MKWELYQTKFKCNVHYWAFLFSQINVPSCILGWWRGPTHVPTTWAREVDIIWYHFVYVLWVSCSFHSSCELHSMDPEYSGLRRINWLWVRVKNSQWKLDPKKNWKYKPISNEIVNWHTKWNEHTLFWFSLNCQNIYLCGLFICIIIYEILSLNVGTQYVNGKWYHHENIVIKKFKHQKNFNL